MLRTGEFQERSAKLGEYLHPGARGAPSLDTVDEVRGRGLWVGIDLVASAGTARALGGAAARGRASSRRTRTTETIRLAPPLVIEQDELDWGLERILPVLERASANERSSER